MPEIPYYYDLHGCIRLVASTISNAGTDIWPRDSIDSGFFAKKRLFVLRSHDIIEKWESDILDSIIRIRSENSPEIWVSVHCVRIGFKSVPEENPIVILIIVKPESVKSIDGGPLVQKVKAMCATNQITDVEVELAYESKIESAAGKGYVGDPFVLKGPFDSKKVLVGDSIGPPVNLDRGSAGTLGAYLSAETRKGDDILLALTNDRVCFDESRKYQEINTLQQRSFRYEDVKQEYLMYTPSQADYINTKRVRTRNFDAESEAYETAKDKLKDRPEELSSVEKAITEAIRNYTSFTDEYPHGPRPLGFVYGTGGSRVDKSSGMPMDWGVIKLTDNEKFGECHTLNRLPDLEFDDETKNFLREKFKKFTVQRDLGYEGSIPRQISKLRTNPPQVGEVFFKVGRTTRWTAGQFNPCKSACFYYDGARDKHQYKDYDRDGLGCYLMWCFIGMNGEKFADSGDSGSLVFDVRGEAIGLFFGGGKFEGPREISFVVSLDVVLRDIESRLDLKNIKFAHISTEG